MPRALDVIFNSVSKKLYTRANLKPKHCHDIVRLSEQEENREDNIRNAIFHANDKEVCFYSIFTAVYSTRNARKFWNIPNASSLSTAYLPRISNIFDLNSWHFLSCSGYFQCLFRGRQAGPAAALFSRYPGSENLVKKPVYEKRTSLLCLDLGCFYGLRWMKYYQPG